MLDQPNLEACVLPNGREGYRLTDGWTYEWVHAGDRRRITIPNGIETDGASIPRILWTVLGLTPSGLISAAALLHDTLYRWRGRLPRSWLEEDEGGKWIEIGDVETYTRQEADRFFARLMREAGVPKLRRRLAFLGVRLFGWWIWREA